MNAFNNYIVLLVYGSLVATACLLIANPLKVNRKANLCFGLFLAILSTYWIEEVFLLCGLPTPGSLMKSVVRLVQSFIPILFYLGVIYFAKPDYRFGLKDVKYLPVPIILLGGIILDTITKSTVIAQPLLTVLIIGQGFVFILLSFLRIRRHKKNIYLFDSNDNEIDLHWLEYIILASLALSIFIGIYNALFLAANLNVYANVFVLAIVYFISYNAIRQKEIFTLPLAERELIMETSEDADGLRKKLVSDDELASLKHQLTQLMERQEPYLDPDLKLEGLAHAMEVTPHLLSYVINQGFDENFFNFVNRYRVDRVKELLLTEKYNQLSIIGIAYESGFNSKTSFNTTFKKITHQTPTEFRKSSSNL